MEMKVSPTKVSAQVSPSSTTILRASVHECKGASVHKNSAECVVLGAVFRFFASCHWL
jgi:hypothetical protein